MRHHSNDHASKNNVFERVHRNYCGRIYNFVLRITHGNTYLAEEITQIVFLKLWEKFEDITDEASLKGYLFTIARNTMMNYLKRQMIEYIYLDFIKKESDEDTTTEDIIETTFLNGYLMKLVEELPPIRKQVFIMSRFRFMTNSQIAEALGLALRTVETHVTLSLKFLRQELYRRYGIKCLIISLLSILSIYI